MAFDQCYKPDLSIFWGMAHNITVEIVGAIKSADQQQIMTHWAEVATIQNDDAYVTQLLPDNY